MFGADSTETIPNYIGRGKFMPCGNFMPQHLYKLF